MLAAPALLAIAPLFGSGKLQYRIGFTCAWLVLTFAAVTIGEIGGGYLPAGLVLLPAESRLPKSRHSGAGNAGGAGAAQRRLYTAPRCAAWCAEAAESCDGGRCEEAQHR